MSISDYIPTEGGSTTKTEDESKIKKQQIAIPHIGTDESGKGDYFGPMVIAGVWVDERIEAELNTLGVKDSKKLSDSRCKELAAEIRKLCRGKYKIVEIPPQRYNQLYKEFKAEGKNLNHLLAWGHARAIESLLRLCPCNQVIADQFGNKKYISSKLMEKGQMVGLFQTPKGERYIAIAAASILARDKFLESLEKLGQDYVVELPKGSSIAVVEAAKEIVAKCGESALLRIAKMHHKTTEKVFE